MFNAKMKFEVKKLITILERNRKKHIEAYEDAKSKYQNRLIHLIEKKLTQAKKGKRVSHILDLAVPEQHTQDYDNMLSMLRSTSNTEVELDTNTYMQISKDEWHWSHSFTSNTLSYTGKKFNH